MAEANKLFREKSVEAIESPEKLDQYLKVTRPGGWVLLAAVLILLAGMITWGCFGHITTVVRMPVYYDEEKEMNIALVPASAVTTVANDPEIEINGQKYKLKNNGNTPEEISADMSVYFTEQGLSAGDVVYPMAVKDLPELDGIVTGTVDTETVSPISFLINPGSGS